MLEADPISERVRDFLTPVSRKQRLFLLATGLIAILFVEAGLVPTKLTIWGMEFERWDEKSLIVILVFATAYFLGSFTVYAIADYMVCRMRIMAVDTVSDKEHRELLVRKDAGQLTGDDEILLSRYKVHDRLFQLKNPLHLARLIIDIFLPAIFGIFAISVMIRFLT